MSSMSIKIGPMCHPGTNQTVEQTPDFNVPKAPDDRLEHYQDMPGSPRRGSTPSLPKNPLANPIVPASSQPSSEAGPVQWHLRRVLRHRQNSLLGQLPQELLVRIFSFLHSEKLARAKLAYRLVCCSWYDASMCGQSKLKDNLVSRHLRDALRQKAGSLTYSGLNPFVRQNLPAVQTFDLRGRYIASRADQAELLHLLLERHAISAKNLIFKGCRGITRLPEGTHTYGDLNLSGTSITHLPQNLVVTGYLDLSFTPITNLPAGLTVGGCLDLGGAPVSHLPAGLKVSGGVYLGGTSITHLPEGLTVRGDLDLTDTPITHLFQGLTVGGNLSLSDTRITHLPKGLTVGGDLDLRHTTMTQVPTWIKVGGRVHQ